MGQLAASQPSQAIKLQQQTSSPQAAIATAATGVAASIASGTTPIFHAQQPSGAQQEDTLANMTGRTSYSKQTPSDLAPKQTVPKFRDNGFPASLVKQAEAALAASTSIISNLTARLEAFVYCSTGARIQDYAACSAALAM